MFIRSRGAKEKARYSSGRPETAERTKTIATVMVIQIRYIAYQFLAQPNKDMCRGTAKLAARL